MPNLPRWVAPLFATTAACLLPMAVVMAATLPKTTQAHHWSTAWAGLDVLIVAAAGATAWAAWRRDARVALAATATGTLLVVDAWFDVMTAAPGPQQTLAIAMALLAELPLAALCAVVAIKASGKGKAPEREAPRQISPVRVTSLVRALDNPFVRAAFLIGALGWDLTAVHDASAGLVLDDNGAVVMAMLWLSPWYLLLRPAFTKVGDRLSDRGIAAAVVPAH